jgi:hypothetical protein
MKDAGISIKVIGDAEKVKNGLHPYILFVESNNIF